MKKVLCGLALVAVFAWVSGSAQAGQINPPPLTVVVTVTIQKAVSIAWGDGTSVDDNGDSHYPTGTTTPFNWTPVGAAGSGKPLALSESVNSYLDNNKTIMVSCLSDTGSSADISARASPPQGWSVGVAGQDSFGIVAVLGATQANLNSDPTSNPAPLGSLVPGTDKPLVLQLTAPSATATLAGVISVTLMAVAQ